MSARPISSLARLHRTAVAGQRDESGQVAILFGLTITGLVLATGGGVDLSRAYQARQKLSEVATLACQYASRPSVVQMGSSTYTAPSGGPTYSSAVGAFIQGALASQNFHWPQTTQPPFSYTANGPASVALSAAVPTAFMQLAGVSDIAVGATAHCYDNPTGIAQSVPNGNARTLIQEGFEATSCNNCYSYYEIPGSSMATPTTGFSQSATYTGKTGTTWFGTGHCLETDSAGIIKPTVPEEVKSAELDCDNGSHTAGNSAISSKTYLPVGNYELRYFYVSRVSYPNYDPVSICGSTAADVSWATDSRSVGGPVANAVRTNQLNVYLDRNVTGSPPTHATIDGSQRLSGANLIDTCVYATNWTERSVRIYVSSPGEYWLTFAADGQNDSYGPQLDDIRLCIVTCAGTVQDNFPTAWLPASNGGVNKVLFRDTFEAPVYASDGCGGCATNGNLNNSTGTSGGASGWTGQFASGWATAPYNQVDYIIGGNDAAEGQQHLELDATSSGSMTTSNRMVSRRFLLMPGYYRYQYRYKARVALAGANPVYCGATPSAAGLTITIPAGYDTNFVGSFMAHSQMASWPIGGGALNSATSFTNPNGSTGTTATVPPNALSISNYDAAQPNPLLDICGYATTWQSRSADLLITKPAEYWLTISALGQATNTGGAIDDVRLTALGSPYMASPPASPVTIPVPGVQPGARVDFTGFYIIANPLKPTAPAQ